MVTQELLTGPEQMTVPSALFEEVQSLKDTSVLPWGYPSHGHCQAITSEFIYLNILSHQPVLPHSVPGQTRGEAHPFL